MTPLVAIVIVIAIVLVLHACATSVADSQDLHELAVRVHTVRNEYLAHLRGEAVVVVGEASEPPSNDTDGPLAAIGPEPTSGDESTDAKAA